VNRVLACFIAAALALPTAALARSPKTFEQVIDLKTGTVLELRVTQSQVRPGKSDQGMTYVYNQTVTVTDEGYRVSQKMVEPAIEVLPPELRLPAGHGMSYLTDEALSPLEIEDWDKVLANAFSALKDTLDDEGLAKLRGVFERYDAASAAQVMLKAQAFVALPQNAVMTLGETVTYEDEIAFPFGNQPVKMNGSFKLVSIDAKAGVARIEWRQTTDKESFSNAMQAMMRTLTPSQQAAMKQQIASLAMERQTGCDYDMDLKTGLVRHADCTDTVNGAAAGEDKAQVVSRWVIDQKVIKP